MKQYRDRAVLDRTDKVYWANLNSNIYVTPMLNLIIYNQDIFETKGKEKMCLQSTPYIFFFAALPKILSGVLMIRSMCSFSSQVLFLGTLMQFLAVTVNHRN